jgi:prevent-host-death family protein
MTSQGHAVDTAETINATEFKAKCLDLLDRLAARELTRVTVTKRGRVVAVLTPPDDDVAAVMQIHGSLKGSVQMPAGIDLTEPVLDEPFEAAQGRLHA